MDSDNIFIIIEKGKDKSKLRYCKTLEKKEIPMPREKIVRGIEQKYHEYTKEEKSIFSRLREKTKTILQTLENNNIKAFTHGSVARGDVSNTSDIDIYIPVQIPSYKIELVNEFVNADRRIIIGTPNSTIKALLTRHDGISLSFPLSPTKEREMEFHNFSGLLYLHELMQNRRKVGVNKKLMLIEPEGKGYWTSSVQANKKRAMEVMGLSQRIIDERIRVLERRDAIGRTGIFLDHNIAPDENFEQVMKKLADRNPIVRKILKNKK
jgi:predicted nucleotidyltransferase